MKQITLTPLLMQAPEPLFPADTSDATVSLVRCLAAQVAQRALQDGRSDSLLEGLRYYRFSTSTEYQKTQRLMPGVVVVVQGRKTAKLSNQALSYDPSHCLVLGGEVVCRGTVVEASASQPYLAIHLDIPPAALVKACVALAEMPETPRPEPMAIQENFVAPVDAHVLAALLRLVSAADTAMDRHTIAPLIVEEIVMRLMRSDAAVAIRSAAATSRLATKIQKSMQFIQAEFRRALSVDELAGQLAMSPSHYAHSFRAIAGVSPRRYLRDLRLNEARVLLLGSALRPSEVAAKVGFDSPAHFTREFKRRFDASPTEYLRRMRTQDAAVSAESIK